MNPAALRAIATAATPELAPKSPPKTGLGQLITGGILTGLGVLNLALSPICKADAYVESVGEEGSDVCFTGSLVLGGALTLIGVPLLLVGKHKRKAYKEWQKKHQVQILWEAGDDRYGLVWSQAF